MRQFFLILCLTIMIPSVTGCASTSSGATETPAETQPTAEQSRDGVYTNGGGTITITNMVAGKGFDFEVSLDAPEACSGVGYSDSATFSDANTAQSAVGDRFTFTGARLKAEPAMSAIGMDCARRINVDFSKK